MTLPTPEPKPPRSAFLPLALLALSLAVFFGWQVLGAVQQRKALKAMGTRQSELASQASQAEQRLQQIMMDLIELAKTDEDAQVIVEKYNIRFNPPTLGSGGQVPPAADAGASAAIGTGAAAAANVAVPAAAAPEADPSTTESQPAAEKP